MTSKRKSAGGKRRTRTTPIKGRFWIAVWMLLGLAMLAWVATRRTSAHLVASQLNDLRAERSVLEARRAELVRRIRRAESRPVLVPRAQALGLRLPADSETIILQTPERERR